MLLKEKTDIIAWLDKYRVKNYTLKPDETYGYVVDVAGDVYLGNKNLTKLCVKFGLVSGDFYCYENKLISLKGAPDSVGGDFQCCGNKLTSLQGCPRYVSRDFGCGHNQLMSLEGMPENIGHGFYCHGNPNLGELQNMIDFKVIKAYFLAEKLADDLNMKDNKKKVKL